MFIVPTEDGYTPEPMGPLHRLVNCQPSALTATRYLDGVSMQQERTNCCQIEVLVDGGWGAVEDAGNDQAVARVVCARVAAAF